MIKLTVTAPPVSLTFEKKHLRKVMRAAGAEVAAVARALIGRGSGGRTYYRDGRKYSASAAGSAPGSLTGALRKGMKVSVWKSGEGVTVRDREYYALFLEAGAKGGGKGKASRNLKAAGDKRGRRSLATTGRVLAPRPFLTVALEARQASVAARIQDALSAGIAFRRMKP